jgi:hypothetical protein
VAEEATGAVDDGALLVERRLDVCEIGFDLGGT